MIRSFFAAWGFRIAAGAAATLALYAGALNLQLASERATVAQRDAALAKMNTDYAIAVGERDTCRANLRATIIDRRNRDETNGLSDDELRDLLGLHPEWISGSPAP